MQDAIDLAGRGKERHSILDRPFLGLFTITWEMAAYATLIVISAGMHFWDLGSRALHHDESLHALYSWYLYVGRGYVHDPMMHGPFLFHANALIYLLFGASDYTARVMPAIFGTVLVGLPYFLRRYLTPAGSLFAAVLLAVSPSILYYGRFIRDDIYVVVWTVALVICMFRYLDERKSIYLYLSTGILALSYATMENTFITVAVFGSFLTLLAGKELLGLLSRKTSLSRLSPESVLILMFGSFTLPQLGPMVADVASMAKIDFPQPVNLFGMNVGMNAIMAGVLVVILIAITVGIGTRWNKRAWLINAAIFYIPFILLFTTFFTNLAGFGTGFWGSLGYWLAQHGVQRGNQPWYYYLILLAIYEFLPVGIAIVAGIYYTFRRSLFTTFLMYWAVGALIGYSYAGEKMPWLVVHITVPFILLSARFLGEMAGKVNWRLVRERGGFYYMGGLPLALVGIPAAFVGASSKVGMPGNPYTYFVAAVIAMLLIITVAWLAKRLGVKSTIELSTFAVFAIALVLTIRAAWTASYYNGDTPVEMLVYTQSAPDIPRMMSEIEKLSLRTTGGKDLKITVDATDSFTWPWAWYLRDYKNVDYPALNNISSPPIGSVLILNASNVDKAKPYLAKYAPGIKIHHRWWFPEDYRGLTAEGFASDLVNPANWQRWMRYFLYREAINPLGSVDAYIYFPKDAPIGVVAQQQQPEVPSEYTTKLATWKDVLTFGSRGTGPSQFSQPTDIKVDSAGNIYVVDSRNNRVQKFDQTGKLIGQIGGTQGQEEGQFNEPWGMAIDKSGNIYVADTWNHRIQKFDSNLQFVSSWGDFQDIKGVTEGTGGKFYGPRDIAIDADGNLYITDTGNKRVQKFDPNGKFLASYGTFGSDEGQFSEPVGIDIDKNGNIYVADTWNHRIQRFDKNFNFISQIPISGWESTGIINKPYLAVDSQNNIVVSDPENNRLLRFSTGGTLLSVVNNYGSESGVFNVPIGVASDGKGNILVADSGSNRVIKLELPK